MTGRRIGGMHVAVAETFAERAKGLIGRTGLGPNEGLLIPRCNCIHTCFMRFPIDATFLDRHGRVVKVVRDIPPWRLCVWGGLRATQVLETSPFTVDVKYGKIIKRTVGGKQHES